MKRLNLSDNKEIEWGFLFRSFHDGGVIILILPLALNTFTLSRNLDLMGDSANIDTFSFVPLTFDTTHIIFSTINFHDT